MTDDRCVDWLDDEAGTPLVAVNPLIEDDADVSILDGRLLFASGVGKPSLASPLVSAPAPNAAGCCCLAPGTEPSAVTEIGPRRTVAEAGLLTVANGATPAPPVDRTVAEAGLLTEANGATPAPPVDRTVAEAGLLECCCCCCLVVPELLT